MGMPVQCSCMLELITCIPYNHVLHLSCVSKVRPEFYYDNKLTIRSLLMVVQPHVCYACIRVYAT